LRFVDASVFLHAYLRPTRKKIPVDVEDLKRRARSIVRRISEEKEEAITSLVHISEIANVLEARAGIEETCDIILGLLALSNLRIVEPSKKTYESAVEDSRTYRIGINDSLAWVLMQEEGISEIYSFDSDFDSIQHLKRISE
jgi:uncharacterized protein